MRTGSWLLITKVGGWACVVHYVMDFQLMLNVYSVNTCIVLGQYRSSCVQGVYINCGGFFTAKNCCCLSYSWFDFIINCKEVIFTDFFAMDSYF